ncbi:P-loop containing nucleoside triphosphate hydrolase protein [Tuber borchii]|uniref:P-loop containing nucleoside triphosphate hydrolase protein n=1 Tax=Tuber borchii TaxID=42251 RepID=A0A2T6ZN46_TUBBO|nr:P-loop containing nucleoside triphosphate hydrolase protein [Tuber borchii]
MPATEETEQEVIIAVMGVTGTGKSYFIREVSGISDVEVSSKLHSCTAEVKPYSFPYAGAKITLVDTPGFNDTVKSDAAVLRDICTWMSSNYRKGKLLSGIIYLHRITDVRMDGSSVKYVKMFQKLCGPDALKNVLLTTTRWSDVTQEQGESREGDLQGGDFWGGLITEGAAVARFMGTRESGLELLDKLMGNEPKPLDIQDQMAEKNMAMAETEVGKFMNGELDSLQKKYSKALKDLKKQHQKAIKQKDDLFEGILAEERAQTRRKLEEAAAQKKLLENLRVNILRELEEAENKREEERQRRDRAVIAVSTKDVSIGAHLTSLFTSYSTIGRLIYDIDDTTEFEKKPFEVEIRDQSNLLSPITVLVKTGQEVFSAGMSRSNYIIYNQGYYQCKPNRYIERGSRGFVIFSKY